MTVGDSLTGKEFDQYSFGRLNEYTIANVFIEQSCIPRDSIPIAGRVTHHPEVEKLALGQLITLAEITRLAQLRADNHACESVHEFLKAKLAQVALKIRQLQQVQAELRADLRKCNQALKRRRGKKACACPVLERTESSHQ
jgi:hypothetical protein